MRKMSILFIVLFLLPSVALANMWHFSWNENTTDADIEGYRIYYEWTSVVADIKHPQHEVTLSNVEPGNYTIVGYDTSGNESANHAGPILIAGFYYNSTRYEYDIYGKVIYQGMHTQQDASEDDVNWEVTKYYYVKDYVVKKRSRTTSWTNRGIGW